MDNALRPLTAADGTQFKDCATAQTSFACRSIEIPGRVMNKIADGTVAVASSLEAINYSLRPFAVLPGRQLVNSANTVFASIISGSIEFTRTSAEQCAIRKTPVGLPVKRIQRREVPFSSRCG